MSEWNQYANLKVQIIKVAKEILQRSPGSPSSLYELQGFLGDINCDEDGVDFGDGESWNPDEILEANL